MHGLRFPYVAGAMARGIASESLVIEMARAGMLGFFGAGGLSPARVEQALATLTESLGDRLPWGCNLIHSPQEPALESIIVGLLLRYQVRRVEASAFMSLTPAVVRYAFSGVTRDATGQIQRANHVFAKISRPEVAQHFMAPPPVAMLDALVQAGELTATEAALARLLPVAEDITCEADSGGHTDNRPLPALIPAIARLRDDIAAERGYTMPIRIGAAGGLGTPGAVAAAFALGADYVQTGSVNQGCVESGLGEAARALLAQADMADVTMAPAADMFEMGVDVQVLKRGTLFAVRARKLYEPVPRASLAGIAIPAAEREKVEQSMLRASLRRGLGEHPRLLGEARPGHEVARAERDPKHQMALVFRSYLGLASRWAIDGVSAAAPTTRSGAARRWAPSTPGPAGASSKQPQNRTVAQVALNLLEGAAAITRAQQLRSYGVPVPAAAFDFRPRELAVRRLKSRSARDAKDTGPVTSTSDRRHSATSRAMPPAPESSISKS
jgi:trans-AT polyketide synthase/acyltransferase/oxidoreductase domain-containing protein